jgi:uncharacterized membrane-anchored protein YitT (DUF2179 family)
MNQRVKDYIWITLGVGLAVSGLNLFLVPNKIAAGGISGIATILYHMFNIPLGLTIAVLNIPLFIFGFRLVGRTFAIRTAYALVLYSVIAEIIPIPHSQDLFIGCVYGGVLVGLGIGLVVRSGGSTGGTDMAAKMLSARIKSMGIGTFVFCIDFVVISAAGLLFNPEVALYALASLFITSKLIDTVTVGLSAAKAFYIISEKNDEIAAVIMEKLRRGVTSLGAKGLYSGKEKSVLLCVLPWRTEGVRLKKIVRSVDPGAFVIVADVSEVLGEGFSSH